MQSSSHLTYVKQDHLFFLMLISVLPCYQPLSHMTMHHHLFLWLFATILLQPALETVHNCSAPDCGCMRDVPGFLQLRNYTTCILICWSIPVLNLALVLCIPICLGFSEIKTSNSDIWRILWVSYVVTWALQQGWFSTCASFFFYHSAISDLRWLEKTPLLDADPSDPFGTWGCTPFLVTSLWVRD